MTTKILEYIDFEKVNTLLEGFNQSTGFVTAILDLDGNVLSKSGWRQICTDFHRVHPETSKKCTISDTVLAGEMAKGEKYHFYKCLNGLVDVAVPIIIKGEHIANLFSGQFFFEKPDNLFFQKQAANFGFNELVYLKALGDVPIISEEKVKTIMEFLLNMTQLISDLTMQRLELVQLNNTLQESEERLRFSLEGANDGIWDVNMQTNEVYISPRGCEMLGYSPSEMPEIAKVWSDLVCPDDLQYTNEILQQYLNEDKPIFEIEQRLRTKSGEFKWVLTRGKVIVKDNFGQPLRMTGTHTDIANRKEEELIKIQIQQLLKQQNDEYLSLNEELNQKNEEFVMLNDNLKIAKDRAEASEYNLTKTNKELKQTVKRLSELDNRLQFALTAIQIGAWDLDLSSHTAIRTTGHDKIFGYDTLLPEWTYEMFIQHVVENDKAEVDQKFNEAVNTKSIWDFECQIRRCDGAIRWIWACGQHQLDENGNAFRMAGIIQDITDRKQTEIELTLAKEKAEESDRLKTAFLQNMSHEIRTPMNAIVGFSNLLFRNANDKDKLKIFTNIISQRCNDLLDIINDILDISKIESGQLPVHLEETNLNELFAELNSFFSEYQKRIDKQHIKFSLQALCHQEQYIIITDKVKLKQIFINLISNAFKFTEAGKIEYGCKFDKNNNLLFFVSDTGIGIPLDKQQFVFERFAQLQQNIKMNVGGTGLGLPIVKALVGLLNSEVSLESEPLKGSTFSFTIPYNPVQPSPHKPLIVENINEGNFIGKTILIVEDDPYNAEYLKEVLSDLELNILHAGNGEDAVEISLSQHVDLILMDIRLPKMDGYEATRQIKQHKPRIKIIAQTAYAAQDEKQKAFGAGCIDYVSKPTKQEVLLSVLNKHLVG